MQVYANSFRIEGKDAFRAAIGAIHGWLKQVMELQFGLHEITRDNELSNDKNELRPWLRVYVSVDETPKLYAWRLKHLDKAVFGRQWIVELGLKVEQNAIDLSCSVLTEEQSTLVREPIEATRPRVIAYVLENVATSEDAHIAHDVPGSKIKLAGKHPEDYRALRMEIERQERDYPLVLVSPTREGTYLINREHLQDALFGLAQVVELLPTYDRYEMEEELGKQ